MSLAPIFECPSMNPLPFGKGQGEFPTSPSWRGRPAEQGGWGASVEMKLGRSPTFPARGGGTRVPLRLLFAGYHP